MKKIVVIIFLLICLNINVNASTYYSEYKYVGTNEIEESDEVKYEEIKLYNTYSIDYKDLGYLEDNNLYIKNENDYIEKEEYVDEYIEDVEELVIVPSTRFQTYTFRLNNISSNTKINEIELIYNDKKIDYKITYNNISNSKFLKDGDYNTYATILSNKAYILFETNINFDIYKLKLVIYTEENNNDSSFDIVLGNNTKNIKIRNNKKHTYTFNNINNIEYNYLKYNKLYRYYDEIKVKNNIYINEGDNLILDDYKYIKKYYKRDKLVLSDNNIINDTYNNLNSFIEYSSDEVLIDCNIDYLKNGTYKCIYKLNDIEVEKEIIVNNNVETKRTINKNIKNKTVLNNNIKKIENTKVVNEVKKNKQQNKQENINKENNINLEKIIKYIIIIFMICIEIILFIKRKRKNVEKV